MLTEQGIIEGVMHSKAMVRIQKSSACGQCDSRGACQVMADKAVLVEVANDLNAGVGDYVELSVPATSVIKLSLFVYFLPILGLVAGACVGGALAESLHMSSTLAAMLGAGLALGISFYGLKRFNRAVEAKDEYHPRMTRIVASEDPCSANG